MPLHTARDRGLEDLLAPDGGFDEPPGPPPPRGLRLGL